MYSAKFFFQKNQSHYTGSSIVPWTPLSFLYFYLFFSSLTMYLLFIDTLSTPFYVCLFDSERNIVDNISWEGKHAEFDTLMESIQSLLTKQLLSYTSLSGIVCLVGPGGFTGIRVTTLVANTIGYSYGIPLYPVTVNAFFEWQKSPPPWILPLTKTEILLWNKPSMSKPIIEKIINLKEIHSYSSNQSTSPLSATIPYVQSRDYQTFLTNFTFPEKVVLLQPIYARDPNISLIK